MKLDKIIEILNTIKKGTYFHVVFKKEYGDYSRTTTTIGRIVKYSNTKEAIEKKALKPSKEYKPNPNHHYLGNNIIFNSNTNETCLQLLLTNCKYHKPVSVYEHLSEEISREEFYEGTNRTPSKPTSVLNIDINDIVAIY